MAIPPTPSPSVCVVEVHESKPKAIQADPEFVVLAIIAHWAKTYGYNRLGQKLEQIATHERREIVRQFLRMRPDATLQDAKDVITAAHTKPETWWEAHMLDRMLDKFFEKFLVVGRNMRHELEGKERERDREQEQAGVREGAAAAVPIKKQRYIPRDAAELAQIEEMYRSVVGGRA